MLNCVYMKKLVIIIAAILGGMLLCAKMSAQDIILTTDSEIISAVITEIGDDSIVYKKADNPDGPNFKINTSRVVKIQFANGTEQVFSQQAPSQVPQQQYPVQQQAYSPYSTPYYGPGRLSLSNKGFMVRVDDVAGNELSDETLEALLTEDEMGTFRGMRVMSNIGRITSTVGAPIFGFGLGWGLGNLIVGGYMSPFATSMMLIGGSVMIPGLIVGLIGDGRIRSVLDDYNHRNGYSYSPTIEFGATPYGMGLTFNF